MERRDDHVCVCFLTTCTYIHTPETTSDKLFTLAELECVGACVNAAVLVVADYSNPPEYRYDYYVS